MSQTKREGIMTGNSKPAKLKPLFFGRLTRIVAGLSLLIAVPAVGFDGAWAMVSAGMLFLGLSFVVGGVMANPGCEITALLNLVLPASKRVHVR